jgi:hypothetical protein
MPDRWPVEGLQQRFWQSQAAGFNHYCVELMLPVQQLFHGGQKLVLHRAAKAAVSKFNDRRRLCIADAAGLKQSAIDSNFTEFVHQNCQPVAPLAQQVAQKGRFAGTKKTGHNGYWEATRGWGHR